MAKKSSPKAGARPAASSRRLGRGLAALLGDQAPNLARAGAPQGEVQVPSQPGSLGVDLLAPSPFQPRRDMNEDRLAELADSIRSRGVIQPILVRPDPERAGRYQIIAGERRWRASQKAGLHEVPVYIRQLDDTDAMAAAMVENLQRSDLNPVEEALGLQRLLQEFSLTQEELAGAIGKSRSHITNTMRLLNLPGSVLAQLRDGGLSAGHARALLGHPDPAAGMAVVLEKGLNVRQTEDMVSRLGRAGQDDRAAPSSAPEITRLEEDLSSRFGLKTQIRFNGRSGSLKINYSSLEQFEALMARLTGER